MRAVAQALDAGSRAIAVMLGSAVLALAVAVMATSLSVGDIAAWVERVLGATFIALLAALVFTSVFCWVRLRQTGGEKLWLEAGLQASAGITTLALTFTLLGITLGIGTLAEHQLTPETVRTVIQELTRQFSLAFLTTVIGLPTSAVMRTLLLVSHARIHSRPAPAASVAVAVPVEAPAPAPAPAAPEIDDAEEN